MEGVEGWGGVGRFINGVGGPRSASEPTARCVHLKPDRGDVQTRLSVGPLGSSTSPQLLTCTVFIDGSKAQSTCRVGIVKIEPWRVSTKCAAAPGPLFDLTPCPAEVLSSASPIQVKDRYARTSRPLHLERPKAATGPLLAADSVDPYTFITPPGDRGSLKTRPNRVQKGTTRDGDKQTWSPELVGYWPYRRLSGGGSDSSERG